MDEKGKRFAKEDKIIEFKSISKEEENSDSAKLDQDKRLKDKNAKKLKRLLKKQKRRELRAMKKFPDEEYEPVHEDSQEEPVEDELPEEAVQEESAPEEASRDEAVQEEITEDASPQKEQVYEVENSEPEYEDEEPEEGEEPVPVRASRHAKERKPKKKKQKKEKVVEPRESNDSEDDLPPKKKKRFSVKRIIAASVIIVLLFCIVFYAFNTDKFSFHNISNFFKYGVFNQQSEERFPLDIKGERVSAGNFARIGQDICYTSDTKTVLLNNYGRSMFSQQHAFITPIQTVSDKGALIYNLGGTGYQLIDKEGVTLTAEAKDNILTADYADNGIYALVTESSGYLSKLYVYNEKMEQIFAYSFADYYVTAVSLNSNGSKAVVAGLSALNGAETSALYVLDFTQEKPLHLVEVEGNDIIYDIEYLNDKYACAIGRNASYVMNTHKDDVLKVNRYDGRELTAFDINTETNTYTVSLSSSGDGRNCDIISYSITGEEESLFSIDKKIINLSTYKGRVALLTGDAVMLYSKDGKAFSEKKLTSDPHSVVMYTSSNAYVLCTGFIDSYSL